MWHRKMLKQQLQNECRSRGLPTTGNKPVLIERLYNYEREQNMIAYHEELELRSASLPARSSHTSPSKKKRVFDVQSDSEDDEIEVAQSLSAGEALQKKFQEAAQSGAILELQDDNEDDDESPPVQLSLSANTTSSTTAPFTPPRFPKGYAVKMEKEKRAKAESSPTKKQKVVDLSLDVSDDEIEVLDVTPSGKSKAGKSLGNSSPVTPEKRKKTRPHTTTTTTTTTALPIMKGCLKSDGVGTEDRLYLHVTPDERDDAFDHGCRWDNETQCFFAAGNAIEFTSEEYPHIKNPKAITQIDVPYFLREKAKEKGARFDSSTKKWFIHKDAPVHSSLVNMFKNGARALRTYLEVSFSEKDEAKERFKGSIYWDKDYRSWYCWKDSQREDEMLARYGEKDFTVTYYYRECWD
ncbi:hypothetical protein TrCOL_g9523 [Triparma columacea]|uniref:SAP domain-containing protein n=1 Tax=Triparma columacea TaxID=722753 RepID=A0A9W7GNT7_9STRA|nr:hypothetical protein TrCOL_g9523 [Triparma columacea]